LLGPACGCLFRVLIDGSVNRFYGVALATESLASRLSTLDSSTQTEFFEIELWHFPNALEELPFCEEDILGPWARRNDITDLVKTCRPPFQEALQLLVALQGLVPEQYRVVKQRKQTVRVRFHERSKKLPSREWICVFGRPLGFPFDS
jgi:hypothetical protein